MLAATARDVGKALQLFGRNLCRVDEQGWSSPTPCGAWDIRKLVNHVVATTTKFSAFAEGSTDSPRTPRGDLLRDDPVAAFIGASGRSINAWLKCDPERTCQLPFGQFAAFEAAAVNVFDVVVHGWDLATALGTDVSAPPSRLVAIATAVADRIVTGEAVSQGFYASSPSETVAAGTWASVLMRSGRSVADGSAS